MGAAGAGVAAGGAEGAAGCCAWPGTAGCAPPSEACVPAPCPGARGCCCSAWTEPNGPHTRIATSAAAAAIQNLNEAELEAEQACGAQPIRGLLKTAKAHHLVCRTIELLNSGDTSGRRDRVVGYGGFAFYTKTGSAVSME